MPRSVGFSIYLCVLASLGLRAGEPPPIEALLKLEGKELYQATEEASYELYSDHSPYSVDELISVAEKLLPGVKTIRAPREPVGARNPFDVFFTAACERAGPEQVDKLVEMYARLETTSFEKMHALPWIAALAISREGAAIREEHPRVLLDETLVPLPPELTAAPTELKEAWKMFRRANLKCDKTLPRERKAGETIEVSLNRKSFYGMIDAALMGRGKGLEDELRKYADTGPNCLGMTDTEDGKDIATLLILLHDRRLDEAVGASLRVAGMGGSVYSRKGIANSVIEFLKACGLDWERLFAGGQAEREIQKWGDEEGPPFLEALNLYGSETTGRLANQLAHVAKPEARQPYLALFNAWIETSPGVRNCGPQNVNYGVWGHKRLNPQRVPKEIQAAFLHTTEEFATSDCPEWAARYAVNTFARTQSPSSIPALQALTHHSASEVAGQAGFVLCAMGVEKTVRPTQGDVRFRILVNGKPLARGTRVTGGVYSGTNGISGNVETREDGIVELRRADIANPRRAATLVRLSSSVDENGGTQFRLEMPPPTNLDAVTEVNVEARKLEIELLNREALNAPASKARLKLSLREPEEHSRTFPNWDPYFEVAADSSIILPSVQTGTYDLSVTMPGATLWRGIAAVGPGVPPTRVDLKPGSTLRYDIVLPDGTHHWNGASLFKDGSEVEVEPNFVTELYAGLPCGKYVLRISGTDWMDKQEALGKIKRGPDEISFAPREVAFAIEPGSPAVIDLGEIHLKPLPEQPKPAERK